MVGLELRLAKTWNAEVLQPTRAVADVSSCGHKRYGDQMVEDHATRRGPGTQI